MKPVLVQTLVVNIVITNKSMLLLRQWERSNLFTCTTEFCRAVLSFLMRTEEIAILTFGSWSLISFISDPIFFFTVFGLPDLRLFVPTCKIMCLGFFRNTGFMWSARSSIVAPGKEYDLTFWSPDNLDPMIFRVIESPTTATVGNVLGEWKVSRSLEVGWEVLDFFGGPLSAGR